MAVSVTVAISLATTAIAAGTAFYYWRRSSELYALLLEGANRYEELRGRNAQLEGLIQKLEDKVAKHKGEMQKLEKSTANAREKATQLLQEMEIKEHDTVLFRQKLEAQRGHLERHLTKVTEQLAETQAAKEAVEAQSSEEILSLKKTLEAQRQTLVQSTTTLQMEINLKERDLMSLREELGREKAQAEKKASKPADGIEVKRLRRKLAQYDRLYVSMKGLREMTDERNRNWEVALKKMATYIVSAKHGGKTVMEQKGVGPLIGEALELIGAQLVDDTIDFSPIRETAASQSAEAAILALEADAAGQDLDPGVGADQLKGGAARGVNISSPG